MIEYKTEITIEKAMAYGGRLLQARTAVRGGDYNRQLRRTSVGKRSSENLNRGMLDTVIRSLCVAFKVIYSVEKSPYMHK